MTASGAHSMLPAPTPDEQRHSERLATLIREAVRRAGGWLSFERFMELALYAPGLGYYSAGAVKLGAGGDFVTAPEVSDLFGRCIARQCVEVLRGLGGGTILELGAGTGRMAAALLGELALHDTLPERYAILEVSADLAARQRERLGRLPPALATRVEWLERLPEAPLTGVVLANEVADALPFRRFRLAAGERHELGVALDADGGLLEAGTEAGPELAAALGALQRELPGPLPEPYTSEVCPRLAPWVASLGTTLSRGVFLLIDYGLPRAEYYHPQRRAGTLRCHFRQRAHDDPYTNLGLQDITAWVDFTAVAEAAVAADLTVAGFCTQAAFLLALGIEEEVARARDGTERARLAGEARRLLMPGEMGEVFKVMALSRGYPLPLTGLALQDLRRLL
jgi:SAM-dependent MidA family methyltransferase